MNTIRVGVLMGGKSVEKEISFNSGRTVCDHLDTTQYTVIPIFQKQNGSLYLLPWHFLHRGKISDFEYRLDSETQKIKWDELKDLIDFMYITVHGRYAEDGTLQGILEILGIPYLGSGIFASALCMDKVIQKTFMKLQGIDTPKDVTLSPYEAEHFAEIKESVLEKLATKKMAPPYMVKPYKEGSSLGITAVFNNDDLENAVKIACNTHPGIKQTVLIEEKIEGMEFTCITITDNKTKELLSLPPTQVIIEKNTHFFDYEQKYMPGRAHKITPPNCEPELVKKIQQTCIKTMHALSMTKFSRIDGFVTKDQRVVIVDPNTLTGMDPASFLFREAAAIGMSHSQIIDNLIKTGCDTHVLIDKHKKQADVIMKSEKKRIAILIGGESNEREISLASGRNVTYKLSPHKYHAIPIFVTQTMELYRINHAQLVHNSTKEIAQLLDPKDKILWDDLPQLADFVFIGLHGGKGENGTIQGTLEMLGVPYNGSSVLTSSLCMDKYKTAQFLKMNLFEVPGQTLIEKNYWQHDKESFVQKIEATMSFPLIVKPHDDGCSFLVQKVRDKKTLIKAIDELFKSKKNAALVEELIIGMELTVGVIGNNTPQALPPSYAVAKSDILSVEEKFLPGAGENKTPAPLSQDALSFVQKTVENVYRTLDCKGYARIDCFYQTAEQSPTKKPRVVILEINSLPGMTPATCIFHQAAEIGIKPMDFIDCIIQFGFEYHNQTVVKEVSKVPQGKKGKESNLSTQ
ncbi:MAG: ATP-grasp domain-containing protein [bacterium]|nr:ATP-grasp domain-containing protein [bacterium]